MSLQDDMFDVAAALEDKPEAAAFDRIMKQFNEYETENEGLNKVVSVLRNAFQLIKRMADD